MNTKTETPPTTDDLELISLGAVLEETRGIEIAGDEFYVGSLNSREEG